jgi:5,10-methylenetetrahydrofolate reductase
MYFIVLDLVLQYTIRDLVIFKHTIVHLTCWNKPEDELLAWAETCRLKYN